MPWVRIDENAMDHPKFIAISANTWRLWCEGMTYCQKHLTNGFMPTQGVKGMRYYSPAAVRQLQECLAPGKGPLWHPVEGGYQVHDYLEWNDSREEVLAAREGARDRRRRSRDRHASPDGEPPGDGTPSVPSGVGVRADLQLVKEGGSGETAEARAGRFCEWYEDTHLRLFGVGYMGTGNDYQKAVEMARKFTDQEMRDGAMVWFGMDDQFATRGTRTIPKFASRITGCLQEARKQVTA